MWFFRFRPKITFLGKFVQKKNQNSQSKVKFGISANSMAVLILFVLD